MAEKEAKDLGLDFKSLGDVVTKFKQPLQGLKQEVKGSIDTFTALSSTGNAFNNDIIGMKVAAANTRMSLDELKDVVTKNGKDMAGLGGSVTKGSQVFTEFSKTFFDSGLTENLRQMGYTSKDLNEVLATQIGFQKSTTDTSVQGQIRTAAAAAALAEEMDLIAKLTGKTRKEQEAQLEESKRNGQIEAKFRLIGLEKGADAEAEARANFGKQLTQAQAMGTEKVFTEMFATGTVRSKEASMQMALLGGAARETANSAKALASGQAAASQAAMDSAKVYNMENQKNAALLRITAIGVGEAANVMKKNIETNDAAFQGLLKTQKAAKALGESFENTAAAMNSQREAIKQEQQARHGVTAATIATTARLQDFNAAIANQVVKPLNEGRISKSALSFANKIDQGVKATDSVNKTALEYQQDLVNQARAKDPTKVSISARERLEKNVVAPIAGPIVKGADVMIGGGIEGFGNVVGKTVGFVQDAMKVYQINNPQIPSRDAGTMGKTGLPFEPQDLIAHIHKGEMVLTPDQAKRFMEGAKTDGLTSAVNEMAKSMPKLDIGKAIPESVSTSTSSSAGFKMPNIDQISFGPDGMPKISARPQATAMANAAAAEKKSQQESKNISSQPQSKQEADDKSTTTSTTKADLETKSATLDDVVKALNSLNSNMNKLLQTSSETNNLVSKQVRVTKSMSGNLFGAQ